MSVSMRGISDRLCIRSSACPASGTLRGSLFFVSKKEINPFFKSTFFQRKLQTSILRPPVLNASMTAVYKSLLYEFLQADNNRSRSSSER